MRVTQLGDLERRPRRVAVGEFDGVHIGHREVISGNDTVLTFEPHPVSVIHPDRAPKLLTSFDRKAQLIAEMGVQELVVVPFSDAFAHYGAMQFIDKVLVGALSATHVSVGQNFHFGHDASGDTALLQADHRFRTRVLPLVAAHGVTVSSTLIRALIASGDVRQAARLLGAPFQVSSWVVVGDRRGRELGFPTANLVPDPAYALPAYGVYAGRAGEHVAAISVGVRPTFGRNLTPLVEAFLLDFSGDLYGQRLTVEFVERLRGELRFDSRETLVAQMHADVEQTRELLGSWVA
ncbi:MAG: bifunctional riboflavin kinase/FAD synthetase [Solirubrobacteraceae bacterium]